MDFIVDFFVDLGRGGGGGETGRVVVLENIVDFLALRG